ncbi:hypothetical protein HPB50_015562 [Hyalomma asiaticum]|uniref:Uncharacterized protein n=1 Tax=Hyalomma asiaticum TaxID=266040 RepID=A0ACB7SUH1_HYAAI|nr:hypothetical protein HPB50_015562 [Hyalomma asiaticum]
MAVDGASNESAERYRAKINYFTKEARQGEKKSSDGCEMEIKGTPPPHSVKHVWPTHKRALWPAQKRALGARVSSYLVPPSMAKLAPVKCGRRAGVVVGLCPPVYYPNSYGN